MHDGDMKGDDTAALFIPMFHLHLQFVAELCQTTIDGGGFRMPIPTCAREDQHVAQVVRATIMFDRIVAIVG